MATGTYPPFVPIQFFDNSGNPLAAGSLETFIAGTLTHLATFSDVGLTVQNANPMTLDASGRPQAGNIFLTPGLAYKFLLKDFTGATIATPDNITAIPASSSTLDVTGVAGETLTVNSVVYLSDGSGGKTAGLWFKGDSANTYSSTTPEVGIAPAAIAIGASGTIRLIGYVTGLSSLIPGSLYYVGAAGAMTPTIPANGRVIGQADTTTTLILTADPPQGVAGGIPTLTNHGVVVGQGSASLVAIAPGTTGQVLTGVTGANPVFAAMGVQDRQVTLQTVVNTFAETNIYTYAVPAGMLGTNRTLRLSLFGDLLQNSGVSDKNYTVRVTYGTTLIFGMSVLNVATGANRGAILLDVELTGANATNAQRSKGTLWLYDSGESNASGGLGGFTDGVHFGSVVGAGNNQVAEDSTVIKSLVVSFQMSFASSLMDMRAHTVYTELK